MKAKTLFFISIAISVVIMFLAGGAMYSFSLNPAHGASPQTKNTTQNPPAAGTQPMQVMLEREAAYQATIRDANERLTRANQEISQLQGQLHSQTAPTPMSSESNQAFPVTPQQAAEIAQQSVGGKNLSKPAELVSLNGTPVYEVTFSQGTVYIDPVDGQVIQNNLSGSEIDQTEAVRVAENYLGKTNVADVMVTYYNNSKVYLVRFQYGETILVDMHGQIVLVQLAPQIGGIGAQREGEGSDD